MTRLWDFLLGTVFLVISIPVQVVVGAILLWQLGSPVMFRQTRAGKDGQVIVLSKFRTMTDARDASGTLLPDDLRQTRLTRLIRRLRLDELPQLLEVMRGRMSLVGPRPLLPQTVAGFGSLGVLRNAVRPGLTGWAQVSGNTRLNDDEKLALDLWYVAHRSLALDLRILTETVLVPIRGEVRVELRLHAAQRWLSARLGQNGAVVA